MGSRNFIILPNPFFKSTYFNKKISFSSRPSSLEISSSVKRTDATYYHLIRKAHLDFYKLVCSHRKINRNFFIKKLSFNMLGDPKYTKKFFKLCLAFMFILNPIFYYYNHREQIRLLSDFLLKNLIINKVCRNPFIVDKISYEILNLVKQERIKKLMRDLVINDVLPDKGLRDDLYRIIKRETLQYLESNHCRDELKNLLIKEVMQNEDLRNDLYSLIKQIIALKEIHFLEYKLEKIIVDVLSIDEIRTHVAQKIQVEVQNALRDENLIRLTVDLLIEKMQ